MLTLVWHRHSRNRPNILIDCCFFASYWFGQNDRMFLNSQKSFFLIPYRHRVQNRNGTYRLTERCNEAKKKLKNSFTCFGCLLQKRLFLRCNMFRSNQNNKLLWETLGFSSDYSQGNLRYCLFLQNILGIYHNSYPDCQ